MLLKRVKIEGFGKFIDRDFTFGPGMNIVVGPNESGKTTLAKFLLYTLSEPNQEALKFKPWHGQKFGGYVETTEGIYTFGEPAPQKFEATLLETVAFVMEDDDLETVRVDKSVFDTYLKKKTERTEEGRILKEAIGRLQRLNTGVCISNLTSELRRCEEAISQIKERVQRRNKLYVEHRKLVEELEELRQHLDGLKGKLEDVRKSNREKLTGRVTELKLRINDCLRELERISWVKKVDSAQVEELMENINKEERLKAQLVKLEDDATALDELIKQKSAELEGKLKMIGATSEHDLESIELRLKHLGLLAKMYAEHSIDAQQADPLWQVFLETPNILERAEEEEKKIEEQRSALESEKRALQEELHKREQKAKNSRDLAIVTAIAGMILFGVSFVFPNLAIPLYVAAATSISAGTTLFLSSRKNQRAVALIEARLVELATKQPPSSDLWRVLSKYGVTNIKTLRRKYEEFLHWKVENKEKERKIQELKQLEQEIIRELSKFGVAAAAQMLVSAVDNLQRTFSVIQDILTERDTLERKKQQLWSEYMTTQRELRSTSDSIDETLKNLGVSRDGVQRYNALLARHSELSLELLNYENELRTVQKSLTNEDENEEISKLKAEIRNVEFKLQELMRAVENVELNLRELKVDRDEYLELARKRDELVLKVEIIKKFEMLVQNLRSHLVTQLRKFTESYHKTFSDEFTKFMVQVVGNPKNFVVSPDLSVKLLVEGELKEPSDFLTGSMKDLVILGMKIAVYKAFYNENVPLVIDNALIRLDDDRLRRVLDYLAGESDSRQIIILTSDRRIPNLLADKVTHISHLEG